MDRKCQTQSIRNTCRRKFMKTFYDHNHVNFILTLSTLILNSAMTVAISYLLQQAVDIAIQGSIKHLSFLVLTTSCVIATMIIGWLLERKFRNSFIERAENQYKEYAFSCITNKSISTFIDEKTARYISSLTNDIISIEQNYLQGTFILILQVLYFISALGMMLWYDLLYTLFIIGVSGISLIISLRFGGKLVHKEKQVSEQNENYIGLLKDLLSGFTVIKSFKAESNIIDIFTNHDAELEHLKYDRRITEALIKLISNVVGLIVQVGIVMFGVYLVIKKQITVGVLIAFVQLMGWILTPIQNIPKLYANRKAAIGLVDKLADAVEYKAKRNGNIRVNEIGSGIICNELSFGYTLDKQVLRNINLHFNAGKSYAIVGASGSGKSTLLNIIMGSYDDYLGSITIGNVELRDINADSLYDIISIIQQNVFIFDSTIEDNITMFKDYGSDKLDNAIKCAGLSKLILERGPNYHCGENGVGLSGGEKQRISIARSLLYGMPILIMDEATSALDSVTAYTVEDAILKIDGLTRVVVTHRLDEAMLKRYDEIVVLVNGSVSECGSFDDLINAEGYFSSLYKLSM